MIHKKTVGEYIFDALNSIFMVFLMFITAYPLYYVAVSSVSDSSLLMGNRGMVLAPKGFNIAAYKAVFNNPSILTGYRTTLIVVVFGTILSVFMTALGAFLITRKRFAVKKVVSYMMLFTMFFSGGMIPNYLNVKSFGLDNTLWALILPGAMSAYNMIIMRTSFAGIPDSLEESAMLDGANHFVILIRIILPLSSSVIAVMVLYYAVGHWNSWFNAMIYLRDRAKYPLQLVLREILIQNDTSNMMNDLSSMEQGSIAETIKYAIIVVGTLPILCVYPFLQKYFVKGVMIGAIKG